MSNTVVIVVVLVIFAGVIVVIQQMNKNQEAKAKEELYKSLAGNTAGITGRPVDSGFAGQLVSKLATLI